MLEFLETQGLALFSQPLLCRLRQGLKQRDGFATGFLFELLNATDKYRATNPRDKIYALKSLLPLCIRKIIRIDYDEDWETLFALLIESTTRNNKDSTVVDGQVSSTPSWAIDFSYSDSRGHTKDLATDAIDATDVVTFEWFLIHNALKITDSQGATQNPMFATPSTLFCDGINIDGIHRTGIIAENQSSNLIVAALSLAFEIQRRVKESARAEASMDMDMEAIYSLISFFCLHLETDSFPRGQGKEIFEARLKEPAGRTYFITDNGLIGIATAPVREGDSLCLLDGVPVYFVLRAVPDLEVEGHDSRSEAAQRHRIVARAVVKGVDLPAPRASFPSRRFQNV
ncbi:hypothetical protein FHL15_008072 [Xylaria flabelliformis]|uniref:Uncharacterized protein n=1 Tax=Xylaria flabelliformis TaxID=2512241 RepID=A0A553HT09_9PEZI|nr:hypothetical protein FHL15_008072 [Xylaria flabelliformis]